MIKKNITILYVFILGGITTFLVPPSLAEAASTFTVEWESPISQFDTIEKVVVALLNALTVVMTPIIVLMVIYSGFLYVTAQGNAEQVKKATTSLTYAVLGGLLVIGAVAITEIIKITVADFQ